VTHLHAWHDSFISVTWFFHTCVMTCSYVSCDPPVTHSYVWHNSCTGVTWLLHTGWRTSIGCLKLQVIFCKRATNYRALLRKVTYKDKAPCDVTLVTWSINIVWRRVIGCLICIDHFPQKSPRISGSFAKNDLQLIRHPRHRRHPVFVTWSINRYDMYHLYTWLVLFISIPWLMHRCGAIPPYVWYDSFIYATLLIRACGVILSNLWHSPCICDVNDFICVTWPIYTCDLSRSYVAQSQPSWVRGAHARLEWQPRGCPWGQTWRALCAPSSCWSWPLSVCMCKYMYICIYVCVYMCITRHTLCTLSICLFWPLSVHTRVFMYKCTYVYCIKWRALSACVREYMYIHIYMYICVYVYI